MITRRQFVTGCVLAPLANNLLGKVPDQQTRHAKLSLAEQSINLTGRQRTATAINGAVPGPTLRWREGELVTIDVTNRLSEISSIHWHGLILPTEMDGVPGLSFPGIATGETFRYQFPVRQSGTYWYHSHSGFQEQTGLYGALVIDPVEADPHAVDRDYVVVLSDWSDEAPERIFSNLRKNSHFYNRNRRSLIDMMNDIKAKGVSATLAERQMWNLMRMEDADISDVTGFTYTYLMNGLPPATGWQAVFERRERIRLRFINASAMTFFDLRIPGLPMQVVAADGQNVHPVTVDDIRLGVAETVDVIVQPGEERPFPLFAQAMDRSGYALGHLTPEMGIKAEAPIMDPVPRLGHVDMGMSREHRGHAHHHSDHKTSAPDRRVIPDTPVTHKATEFGPHVDMRAELPRYRLDDPGVGLRHLRGDGRRVLTYADLVRLEPIEARDPDREIELHLTGNMERYTWSIDGVPYADAPPLQWRYGERVRVTLVNDTMMNHPMHLHGMWSELETGSVYLPRKHTVVVQPGSKVSYHVQVDARGRWAYHCHLMFHMMGMFREVKVS